MKQNLHLILIIITTLFLSACNTTTPPVITTPSIPSAATLPPPTLLPPQPAPDFTLTTLDNQTITLSQQKGRWVLVNFWATWCIPCLEEMPYLQTVADTHADNLILLAVNMNDDPATITQFITEHNITFPILLNPDPNTTLAYRTQSLPRTALINPDGDIVYQQFGPLTPANFDPLLNTYVSPQT